MGLGFRPGWEWIDSKKHPQVSGGAFSAGVAGD